MWKNSYLLLALAMAGCVDNTPGLQLFNAWVPDAECVVDTGGPSIYSGSLDLSTSSRFLMGFSVQSSLVNTPIEVNDRPVSGSTGDDNAIYISEIEVEYDEDREGLSLASESYPAYFVVQSGSDGTTLVVDLAGPGAIQVLQDSLGVGESVLVNARLKVVGETTNGGSVESNEVNYPIEFYKSGFSCPTGTVIARTGPCGTPGGQNGQATCVDPNAPAP
ncbi:hypothetical protein [Myxococcus sp. RHSTA-1-4]|uniref:hypothetical protein n=1 Tax=Myxococcus sp. RHSTA-1-4 TaxID=2874601 RepID=UPI001CBD1CB5|nr:hypothetical protein [Myxococcus sp. RHSTA-1-4]MBZ4422710.1 hypothetical protein [Myxococcus sp. RHSTA-1-4]